MTEKIRKKEKREKSVGLVLLLDLPTRESRTGILLYVGKISNKRREVSDTRVLPTPIIQLGVMQLIWLK